MGRLQTWLLDLFFPPKCVFCGKLLVKDEMDICSNCRLDLPIFQGPEPKGTYYSGFSAVFYYEGVVRESLHRFKFGGMEQYAQAYGGLMRAAVARLPGTFDLVTWCPVSAKRRKKRGYDQGEVLAKALGRQLNLPVVGALGKSRDNQAQSSLGNESQRRANVLGVYVPVAHADVTGKRILLVDDIATTGATLLEASRVLLTAGAADVCCAVVAATREH